MGQTETIEKCYLSTWMNNVMRLLTITGTEIYWTKKTTLIIYMKHKCCSFIAITYTGNNQTETEQLIAVFVWNVLSVGNFRKFRFSKSNVDDFICSLDNRMRLAKSDRCWKHPFSNDMVNYLTWKCKHTTTMWKNFQMVFITDKTHFIDSCLRIQKDTNCNLNLFFRIVQ